MSWVVLLPLAACIELIELDESLSGARLLVVEGEITDRAGPYQVKLSYTSATLEAFRGDVLSGAEVYISDANGNRAPLTETTEPGTYETDSATFRGEEGGTYTVDITTPAGKRYASLPETMPEGTPIDSVYFQLESRPKIGPLGDLVDEWGLQFYVQTGDGGSRVAYYRWKWDATFRFRTPIPIPQAEPIPGACFTDMPSGSAIRLATTEGLMRDRIEEQQLNFVPIAGRGLQIRYSLLVQQHALTEGAYNFWEDIVAQQTTGESIFDPPPSPIAGNLYNVDDDSETVLGYFQVASVVEKRIFVPSAMVPANPDNTFPGSAEPCRGGSIPDYCFDCSLIPGTYIEPPSFW